MGLSARKHAELDQDREQARSYIWFVVQEGVMKGPYKSKQLESKLSQRDFAPHDYCWRQGFNEWRPLGAVPELQDPTRQYESLPAYPQLEVPGAKRHPLQGQGEQGQTPSPKQLYKNPRPWLRLKSRRKEAVVDFRHSRRSIWSLYEWGAAVIFATIVAYMVSYLSLGEVRRLFFAQLAVMHAGQVQWLSPPNFDEVAPHPIAWEPLFSAPGWQSITQQSRLSIDPLAPRLHFVLPVSFSATHIRHSPMPGLLSSGEREYQLADREQALWDPAHYQADPVYIRPVQLNGYLSLENTGRVWTEHPSQYTR